MEEQQNNDTKLKLYIIYLNAVYIINCILFPPAKIMAIIWTCSCVFLFSSDDVTFIPKIVIMCFGYLLYCGIADLIYVFNKKRYTLYKIKIIEEKKKRLEKAMGIIGRSPCTLSANVAHSSYSLNYDNMEGHDFEYFCAAILRENGFINVEVTQGSGDHGIDVLAEKDDISYAIQCKCYSSNIGNAAVQQAHTGKSLYNKDVAVVMTNQYFTQQAKEEAQTLRVKLWDRDKLNDFIKKSEM